MKYEKFNLGNTIETLAQIMRVVSIAFCFLVLLVIYTIGRELGGGGGAVIILILGYISYWALKKAYNPLINIHKNTILFIAHKISNDFYNKKRRNALIASIILAFTGIGVIIAVPIWIFLSKTKNLLREEYVAQEPTIEQVKQSVNVTQISNGNKTYYGIKRNNKMIVISIITICAIGLIVFFILNNNKITNSENKPINDKEELIAVEALVELPKYVERIDTTMDEKGNIIERKFVNDKLKYTYTYDSINNLIEEKSHGEGYYATYRYRYNNQGNKIEQYKYFYSYGRNQSSNNGLSSKHTYKYDSKNNLIEECEYSPNSELKEMKTYKFNSNGTEIEYRSFNIDYFPHEINAYMNVTKYDNDGYEIETIKKRILTAKEFKQYGLDRRHSTIVEE